MEERLNTILNHFGLSPSQLATKLGVQRSGVSHILSGRNRPGLDFITKLLHVFPQIDPDWLLTGKGSLLRVVAAQTSKPVINGDLFDLDPLPSKTDTAGPVSENVTANTQINEERKDKHISKKPDDKLPPALEKSLSNEHRVEKVLILYKDGTYDELINANSSKR